MLNPQLRRAAFFVVGVSIGGILFKRVTEVRAISEKGGHEDAKVEIEGVWS